MFSRRSLLLSATTMLSAGSVAICPDTSVADDNEHSRSEIKILNVIGEHRESGNYVPVTLGVPDSVPAGENLALIIVPFTDFPNNPAEAETYLLTAVIQNGVDVDLLGTGGAPLERRWAGDQGPEPLFLDVAIGAAGINEDVIFTLLVSAKSNTQIVSETAEIVCYKW